MQEPFGKFLNKEVFVIGVDDTEPSGPLEVFDKASQLFNYLKDQIEIGIDSDVRVLHGVLTKADTLPSSTKGKVGFILAFDAEMQRSFRTNGGCIAEQCFADVGELATQIEGMIGKPTGPIHEVEIEYLYILYGYELKTFVSVDLEELDEETIHTCKKVAEESESIRERALEVSA